MCEGEVKLRKCAKLLRVVLFGALWAFHACADPAPTRRTIGEIWFGGAANASPYQVAFRERLRELGYREDSNVTIISRYANGDAAQLPRLVEEMVALDVDAMLVSNA